MSRALNIHDGMGQIAVDPSLGILLAYGSTVPAAATVGYAPGCRFIKTNGNSIATVEFVNIGTKASANFVNFVAAGLGGIVVATCLYGELTPPTDMPFFIADRAYQVQSITGRTLVAGTGGAATAELRKAPSGTAAASGTILHSGTFNLVGTVNTTQTLTLSATAADLLLAAGDSLNLDVTGTTTSARGIVSIALLPV